MRNKMIASAALACSAFAVAAAPIAAEAQSRRVLVCENTRKSGNTGTVIGAVAGGLLGNAVASKGVKTEGTVLGAGVGAVAGHQIAKKKAKKNCRYVYR
ncbi:glycine zipper 2TM domain-containing protein [Phenylobacterium deserti]|nr:glycine zipper 2TM domain-containing protein [Phenylobacterium deserti]